MLCFDSKRQLFEIIAEFSFAYCSFSLEPVPIQKNKDIMSDKIIKNERKKYASDLTDSQGKIIKSFLPKAGTKSKWKKRELIKAVLSLLEKGCKWRNLPRDFPSHTTVSNFYYAAVKSGIWENLLAALVKYTREKNGRKAEPNYGIIDSQSVKTAGRAENKGIDGKKLKVEKVIYSG